MPQITDAERWTLINALSCAAAFYEQAANDLRHPGPVALDSNRVPEQLTAQAEAARELAERLEAAEAITVEGA